ncbi:hypothetical protein SAMN05444004_10239 [Jannaschia faecimaris]|uniref:Methyltransferase domain-containing protein n=2 Tax=Jannaschia faecimaris TaxID=1244108 RepID=A0A1H3L154_9RHOB|nr:hypothetical protein SAMN05444004_10239 [Jannaschia faecimaris]
MGQPFPDLKSNATILLQAAQPAMPKLASGKFGLTLTMAVLLHLHPDSEWIFGEMLRVTEGYLVVIGIEKQSNYKVLARQYRQDFESLGAIQIHDVLPTHTTRIFRPR